jgi:ABC-2 type transport system permease protein
MRSAELIKRNVKEVGRDPLNLGLTLVLPPALLIVLDALGGGDATFLTPTMLAPGIALFGFVMLMFSSAMILARDRESALLSRLLTAPLRADDFVGGYSLPYLAVAVLQSILVFAVAAILGAENGGGVLLIALVLFLMAIFYVSLGMTAGSLLGLTALSGAYTVVLLLTIFGGAWFDLEEIGGAFETVGNLLPFKHALDAMRAVMVDGAGLGSIGTDLVWVACYTVAAVALAIVTFRRKMLE